MIVSFDMTNRMYLRILIFRFSYRAVFSHYENVENDYILKNI